MAVILILAGIIGLITNDLRPDRVALDSNWSPKAPSHSTSVEIPFISIEEAEHHFFDNTAFFLDARSPEDYHRGHIKGARNLPVYNLEEKFMDISKTLPTEQLIITYCEGKSCRLSVELARFLMDDGFNHVKVLNDGWTLWRNHHLPIAKETSALP